MKTFEIRVYPEKERLPKEEQLAWHLAQFAFNNTVLDKDATEMAINRIIDNTAVALAATNRPSVVNARNQALAHSRINGATLFGLEYDIKVHAEWASWANNCAVRELDFHDTFLAADYSHPGDNIPPLIAVAQQKNISGKQLLLAILTAYEVQINLVKAICLHKHNIDHVLHLGPSVVAGLGTLLKLAPEVIYQALNQIVHLSVSTRQSRKGQISNWKAYAPGHVCKLAIEAVDRAIRGETSPSPIWEGEDSVITSILDGPDAIYNISLPEKAESCKGILESYTKEHSAEYQAQALIDLAFKLRKKLPDRSLIEKITIYTSHHTHKVIGSGANDPQKYDPEATRETLDHSIMYIFAVALEDGFWHHINSYTKERSHRKSTVALWKKISTVEDKLWTSRYHETSPEKLAFGGSAEILMSNGAVITDELANANAHSLGLKPFKREDFKKKFYNLTSEVILPSEAERFLELVETLISLSGTELEKIHPVLVKGIIVTGNSSEGIF